MSKLFLDELPESLSRKIGTVVRVLPSSLEIFEELYKYALNENSNDRSGRHKKPRIDVSSDLLKTDEISETNTIFKLEGVSVLSPLRKKLDLVFYLSNVDGSPVITLLKGNDRELSIYQLNKNIKMACFLIYSTHFSKSVTLESRSPKFLNWFSVFSLFKVITTGSENLLSSHDV